MYATPRTMRISVGLTVVACFGTICCEPALSNRYGIPGNFGGDGRAVATRNRAGANSFSKQIFDDAGHEGQDYIDNQPKSYEFGYAVKDQATGNDFGRQESSDGETVRGEYRVQLPDGRTQIVSYTADWRTGFHAEVRYEGTANYPDRINRNEQNPNNNQVGRGFGQDPFNGGNSDFRQGSGNYNFDGSSHHYQVGSIDGYGGNFGTRAGYASSPTYGPNFH